MRPISSFFNSTWWKNAIFRNPFNHSFQFHYFLGPPRLPAPCAPPSVSANYRQMIDKLAALQMCDNLFWQPLYLVFSILEETDAFAFWQVTGKLNSRPIRNILHIPRCGCRVKRFQEVTCDSFLISLETFPEEESGKPNRSRRELFVSCSPCTCLTQACR